MTDWDRSLDRDIARWGRETFETDDWCIECQESTRSKWHKQQCAELEQED